MILDDLAAQAQRRVALAQAQVPYEQLLAQARALPAGTAFPFLRALRRPGLSFICEVKKASPSKGLIAPLFPYLDIARDYEAGGAAAVSVLTEPRWFLGSDRYLQEIAGAVQLPLLRKDFTVSPYMVAQAKLLGASAVLLICAILTDRQLRDWRELAESLGMSALVEAHDEAEIRRALASGANIVGVNNRNLKDFTVDTRAAQKLRALVPPQVLFVSESGVRGPAEIAQARQMGADAVLVGEALMRAPDRRRTLADWREQAAK